MTLARNLADLGNQVDSSGTLGIGGGGTSATNATAGFNALAPSQTSNTNKYLTTNGTNTSWADVVSGMTVTSLSYSGDDQAVDPTTPLPCTLTGTNFVAGSIVYVNTISAANSGTSINVTSSTSITFTPPSGLSAASYNVWIVSPTGTIAILANGILYSGAPSWAGQSTSLSSGASVSIQLTATGDTPLTYSLVSGTLPTGTTLSSSGLISGTASTAGTFPNIVVKATDPESQDASVTIEITITLADAYFRYVTMLLHGDGANGAQNNTFVDSSSNNFSISRNGNTTQGSFSPYGSNWSNYFDGSSYLSTSSSSTFGTGTGNFTLEAWVYITQFRSGSGENNIVGVNATGGWLLGFFSNSVYVASNAQGYTTQITYSLPTNQWVHIAGVRNGNTVTIYVNGTSIGSGSYTTNNPSGPCIVGGDGRGGTTACMYGYASNVRVSNTARYSSTFTPSTTPLTNDANTLLLSSQSNRFIDNSSNAFALTVNGTPSVQRFSPFAPSSAYSTATIGGSGYFDGSGDYLSLPSSSAFTLGSGDFTAEMWGYFTVTPNGHLMTFNDGIGTDSPSGYYYLAYEGGGIYSGGGNASGSGVFASYTMPLNQWVHIVACRSGTVQSIFANGVRIGTRSDSTYSYTSGSNPTIGRGGPPSTSVTGYLSNVRLLKGVSAYAPSSTTITIPTVPSTAVSGTSFLCNYTNGTIYDNAMMNDLETVGNAQISTSVVKYGTGSIAFDGTNSTLTIPSIPSQDFNTGNFTIECWIYRNATGGTYFIADFGALQTNGWGLYDDGSLQFRIANSDKIQYNIGGINAWYHIAITRSGSTLRMFVNGNLVGSTTDSTNVTYSGLKYIGSLSNSSGWWSGYIDDFRITKGYARYTANFTPPASAFANQ